MALSDGLVGYWSAWLGSSGYRLLDRTRYANHGTLTNMDAGTDWVGTTIQGRSGYALDFDGSNDYIELQTNGRQYPNLTAASWNFWVKFDAFTNSYNQLVETFDTAGVNSNYQLSCLIKSNGKLAFYAFGTSVANQSNYDGTGAFTLAAGTWYMLTYVFHGSSRQEGYVNAARDGGATSPVSTLSASSQNVTLSSSVFATRFVDGQYAQASLWSRALRAEEILELYRLGPGWYQPYQRKRYAFVGGAGFKAYWAKRQSQLIGGGV